MVARLSRFSRQKLVSFVEMGQTAAFSSKSIVSLNSFSLGHFAYISILLSMRSCSDISSPPFLACLIQSPAGQPQGEPGLCPAFGLDKRLNQLGLPTIAKAIIIQPSARNRPDHRLKLRL